MANGEDVIEDLILGMRDGKDPLDIVKEVGIQNKLHMKGDVILNEDEAIRIAYHVVYSLYDGKFPVDHLEVGDICIDAFQTSPCIITNVNDRSIHVLYFNGKTHKFKKSQERYFKKTGMNFRYQLQTTIDNFHQAYFVRQAQNDEDRKVNTPYNEQILNINEED